MSLNFSIDFTPDTARRTLVWVSMLQGFGLGLMFVPLNMIALSTVPVALRTQGTAMWTLIRNLGSSIGVSVVIEQVFALPGIGRMVVQAILARDYPLVQGTMLIFGFTFVLINLLVDVLYTLADPRVRHD